MAELKAMISEINYDEISALLQDEYELSLTNSEIEDLVSNILDCIEIEPAW